MSVKVMGLVFDADLPRDEKYVLLSYADHAAHDGTGIYPSVERMTWKTGYARRSIQTITAKLREKGILVRDGKGWHGTNRYRIDLDALPQRKPYDRGAQNLHVQNLQGRRKQHGGAQKTAQGGAESAPNPSLTVHESSLVDAKASTPVAEKQVEQQQGTPLTPDTWQSRMAFARLMANAKAKGRRGPKRFSSIECKDKFDGAAETLDGQFEAMLKKALEQGALSVTGMTNYIAKCAENMRKSQQPNHIEVKV